MSILGRAAEWVVGRILSVPGLRVGALASEHRVYVTAAEGDPEEPLPVGSLVLRVGASSAEEVLNVRHGAGYATPVKDAADAAEAAQAAADAAQADIDEQAVQIGDLSTIIGGEGQPGTLAAGFSYIISWMNTVLLASRVRAGLVTVADGQTTGTVDLANGWTNKAVVVTPHGSDPGNIGRYRASISGGILTVTVQTAPSGGVVFSYVAFDL